MTMNLRKSARSTRSVFDFVAKHQNTKFRGCTGARELAAIWYRYNERFANAAIVQRNSRKAAREGKPFGASVI